MPRAHRARHLFVLTFLAPVLIALTGVAATAGVTRSPQDPPPEPQTAETPPAEPGTMLVIGDSYSSYYGGMQTRNPGWWAYVAADLGLTPEVHAIPGTGFLARGDDCTSSRYHGRMAAVRAADPTILMIEGGRNDWRRCTSGGQYVEATRTEISKAVNGYFSELDATWASMGRSPADVYVVSPWGRSLTRKATIVRSIISDAAQSHGFNWIPTQRLSRAHAPDGIHPNNAGSLALFDQITRRSDLMSRFATQAA